MKKAISVIVSAVMLLTGAVWLTGCEEKAPGTFYTLQEGYDNGWLTQEDLLSIAYYGNGRSYNKELIGEDFVPLAKAPEQLDEETEEKIKKTYVDFFTKENSELISIFHLDNSKLLDLIECVYCGTYYDHIAIKISSGIHSMLGNNSLDMVANVKFYYGIGDDKTEQLEHWLLWKENNMFFWW